LKIPLVRDREHSSQSLQIYVLRANIMWRRHSQFAGVIQRIRNRLAHNREQMLEIGRSTQ
jgi:hypothetical protein